MAPGGGDLLGQCTIFTIILLFLVVNTIALVQYDRGYLLRIGASVPDTGYPKLGRFSSWNFTTKRPA